MPTVQKSKPLTRRNLLVSAVVLAGCSNSAQRVARPTSSIGPSASEFETPTVATATPPSTAASTTTTPQAVTVTRPRTPAATVVLVHGAWHDKSTWDDVMSLLVELDVPARRLTLPSTNPDATRPGLAEDAAAVTALIEDVAGPAVLLGHSYGGMVINAAGLHPRVAHLVFLAAFCPDEGQTVVDLAVGKSPPLTAQATRVDADGTMSIDPALAVETFYGDVDPVAARRYAEKLQTSTAQVFLTPAGSPAWRVKPTTYVVCTQDRAISVDRQDEMAERATADVRRWDTSHSPFHSRPDLVAQLIRECAEKAANQ